MGCELPDGRKRGVKSLGPWQYIQLLHNRRPHMGDAGLGPVCTGTGCICLRQRCLPAALCRASSAPDLPFGISDFVRTAIHLPCFPVLHAFCRTPPGGTWVIIMAPSKKSRVKQPYHRITQSQDAPRPEEYHVDLFFSRYCLFPFGQQSSPLPFLPSARHTVLHPTPPRPHVLTISLCNGQPTNPQFTAQHHAHTALVALCCAVLCCALLCCAPSRVE